MIKSITIKNFKRYVDNEISLSKNNLIIGENDSGKTSILEALDIFFNDDKIMKSFIINPDLNVEISILYKKDVDSKIEYLKKIYAPPTYKEKINERKGNFDIIDNIKFVYLRANILDPMKLITELAQSRTINSIPIDIINSIKNISQTEINNVISSIGRELLLNNNSQTEIIGTEQLKIDASIKYQISSNGIPIEGRGLGFQKTVIYSLLCNSEYKNTILGVDEIENSISINNVTRLIEIIKSNFKQTIITTHSRNVISVSRNFRIIPRYINEIVTMEKLFIELDSSNSQKYLLVEGKTDVSWFEKALEILMIRDNYIILPCGGSDGVKIIRQILINYQKDCYSIIDGDSKIPGCISLSKECIELYIPIQSLCEIFENQFQLNILDNKPNFFNQLISSTRSKDSVKKLISANVDQFLNEDNALIFELRQILNLN